MLVRRNVSCEDTMSLIHRAETNLGYGVGIDEWHPV
jgi:hypothetical protein